MTKEEARELFRRAIFILNDIDLQNKLIDAMPHMTEDFLPGFAKERMAMGDVDEWPEAKGKFGRTPTNPILTNRTWGEITYLSRLETADGQRMIFHRLGSVAGAIDAFELVSVDGKFFDVLYVDMYHHNCSRKAPTGYNLLELVDGITGTSENIPDFPAHVTEAVVKTAINKFGAPIVCQAVFDFNREQAAKLINEARRNNNLRGKILGKTTI
ncbi:MAG: hypothetical protein IJS69_03160 [Selenomonadaceae bacterium]|nr:hypothetical protein [Selenomonadaceae bacterium]